MRESDKGIGISRDMQRSRKPDRRDTDIADFVSCLCHRCEKGLRRKRSEASRFAAGLEYCPRRGASFLTQINDCRAARAIILRFCGPLNWT